MKTPIFNIHDLILVLTLAVCVLLAIFQLLLSKQKKIASYLLATFFAFIGLNAYCNLLLWNDYSHIHSAMAKTAIAYGLVIAVIGKSVCLYLYITASTRKDFRLRKFDFLHLLNAVLAITLLLVGRIDSDQLRFISPEQTEFTMQNTRYLWHYLKILPVAYAVSAAWAAMDYKRQLKAFYSSLSLEGPQWLLLLTAVFAFNWLWSLAVHILGQSVGITVADNLGIFDNYATFVLVNALFVYSLLYAHMLLETRDAEKEKVVVQAAEPSPDLLARIQEGMEVHQLYLRQNLTIEEFAKQIGMHHREASTIINKHFDTNFFEFVNLYRVNRAKEMLVNPKFSDTTILDILLEAGFNSKSEFQRFFKRYTGMSAADYRKQHAGHPATKKNN